MYQCHATLTSVTSFVSDDVWQQLERPAAASATGRPSVLTAVVAAVLTTAAVVGAGLTGVIEPQIIADPARLTLHPDRHAWTETWRLNTQAFGAHRVSVDPAAAPGVRATATPASFVVHHSSLVAVTVHYVVTDCALAPGGTIRLRVEVSQPWGTQDVTAADQGAIFPFPAAGPARAVCAPHG
jgi:hypothetical protein